MSEQKEEKRNRKLPVALLLVFASVVIVFGVVFAFFSDVITGGGSATAGTLRLSGTYTYKINGGAVTPITTAIANLNPGDVIEVGATITPTGNKSAWVRSTLQFTTAGSEITPYIYVFNGSVAQATLLAANGDTAIKAVSGYVTGGTGSLINTTNVIASAVSILNGTGTGAESETDSGGVNSVSPSMTIYFAKEALNPAQGKPLAFTATTQALQYRNNTTPAMTSTDARWSQAVAF